jgi:hypothetical protein
MNPSFPLTDVADVRGDTALGNLQAQLETGVQPTSGGLFWKASWRMVPGFLRGTGLMLMQFNDPTAMMKARKSRPDNRGQPVLSLLLQSQDLWEG